jgi:hypothetical protein
MSENFHPKIGKVEQRSQIIHDIGLDELQPEEVVSRRDTLRQQTQIGLQREGPPTRKDGGLLAIRTGIPPLSPEAWNQVPSGSKAFVADIAGTNWSVMSATKGEDGSVSLAETSKVEYNGDKRVVTFSEFISRIAYPIAGEVINNVIISGREEESIDVGVSLGFPHENIKTPNGMDALLVDVKKDGTLPKGWQITDWNPEQHKNITQALRDKLKDLGIKVRTLVAINDTPAVALDGGAVKAATKEGLDVIPAGFVGGTGTNGAVDKNGLVNLEIGHAAWPSDEIFQRMKKNGWVNVEEPELEPETGMYLPFRLAAGMQLLHEQDNTFQIDDKLLQELISKDPNNDAELISKLASGKKSSYPETQQLAQKVMRRAGQVYGITLTTIAEVAAEGTQQEDPETRKAFLVEGGTLLKGHGIKESAEQTAASLGQPIKIVEAKGLRGVGSLAMAYSHLEK